MAVKKYSDLIQEIKGRGAQAKQAAAAKKAGYEVPSVPEKDPNEKGTVNIPSDPAASAANQNVPPASQTGTNTNQTPVKAPPPVAETVISGQEKPAAVNLVSKAASVAASLKQLRNKQAATASNISTNGSLPNDAGNENKNNSPTHNKDLGPSNKNNPDPNAKTSSGEAEQKAPDDKTVQMPAPDKAGQMPPKVENSDATTKEAGDLGFNLDPEACVKIAHVMYSTEENRAMLATALERAKGAAAAEDIIKSAMYLEQINAELAEHEAAGAEFANNVLANASPEEQEKLVKLASLHAQMRNTFETEFEKSAYDAGAQAAGEMTDAGMITPEGGEGPMPEGFDPSQISNEDIVAVLDEMVQNGEIPPEEAAKILEELLGGAEGGGEAPPEGAAPGAEGAEGTEKGASAKDPVDFVNDLFDVAASRL